MSTKISMAAVRLDDAAAMTEFLSSIPDGDQLAKLLEKKDPVTSRAYDDDAWTARFVASDGTTATCFTVTDITIDQAEMIAAACADIRELDLIAFRQAVEEALGPTFDPAE
jgi:hypothetical protein